MFFQRLYYLDTNVITLLAINQTSASPIAGGAKPTRRLLVGVLYGWHVWPTTATVAEKALQEARKAAGQASDPLVYTNCSNN